MFTKDQINDIIINMPTLLPYGRRTCASDVHPELQNFLEEYVYSFDNDLLDDTLTEQAEWMDIDDIQKFVAQIANQIDATYVKDEDSKNGIFIIFDNWNQIGEFHEKWNRKHHPLAYLLHRQKYIDAAKAVNKQPFQDMRLDYYDRHPSHENSYSPYLVQDGLADLDCLCEYGFADEWTTCDYCNETLIGFTPQLIGLQPTYFYFEVFGYVCEHCIKEDFADEYIAAHINKSELLNIQVIDPDNNGWIELEGLDFENGLHHGQNADPKRIIATLKVLEIDCIFTGNVGQFDINFNVWVPTRLSMCENYPDVASNLEQELGQNFFEESDCDDEKNQMWMDWVRGYLDDANTNLPYDQAEEFARALRGDGSEHISVTKTTI